MASALRTTKGPPVAEIGLSKGPARDEDMVCPCEVVKENFNVRGDR